MFPVMLEVRNLECLVVGGGGVALRKAESLVGEGARVTVVAPVVVAELSAMADRRELRLKRRAYRHGEAAGYLLAFAATDEPAVNRQVHDDAVAARVWVNVADEPELCTFQLPARVRSGPLELAISSGGQAPFAVRRLRALLEGRFGAEWGGWARAAAQLRARVRGRWSESAAREACYDRFFAATVDSPSLSARVPSEDEVEGWVAAGNPIPAAPGRGFVSLVGAGPGCPGLLTLRARDRLLRADAVAYDRLAAPALPPDLPSHVELHSVGKESGHHPIPQPDVNALLIRLALAGKRVVRFKGGDPCVFGRGGEEAEALAAAGIPFEIVPGVTAAVAVAAWAGIPLTHRREAVRATLLTAHESAKDETPQVRWDLVAQDPHATLAGYMGVTALPNVVQRLLEGGMDPAMPAAIVERGTTAAQRVVVSTLAALPGETVRAGIAPPALFVIGPTVRHAGRLDWLHAFRLAGERLAVFPSAGWDPSLELERAGAEVVPVRPPVAPVTRILAAALPLTGCVLRSAAQAAALEVELAGVVWTSEAVCWCLGAEAARAARACLRIRIEELDATSAPSELVARIGQRTCRPS